MKTLIAYLKPFLPRMGIGLLIKIIGTLVELTLPYILSHILETVILNESVKEIIYWGSLMILCSGIACLFNIIANRMAAKVSKEYSLKVRHDLFNKTLKLSSAQIDKFTVASLESRITNDTYNVHHFVGVIQRMGVRAPIMLFGGVAITLIMDSFLSLVMIATIPIIFTCVYLISRKTIPLYTKVQRSIDNMVRVVREDAQGIRVIKALSKETYEQSRYDKVNSTLVRDEKRAGITMSSLHPITNLFMNLGIVAVVAISAARVTNNLSSPETVIAFMQYFTQISMSLMALTRIFNMASKSMASANRIEEVLLCEDELPVLSKEKYPPKNNESIIEFSNVCFSYNGKKEDLTDINFEIKKGENLGIIGATGSGKSTIIKLLLRFYDVSNGAIYLFGEDIRTIDKEKLYSYFGSVMQNDFLYNDTTAENIRFGRKISDEQVVWAAKIAQAHDFIADFSEGYDHVLSQKGTNISGGQKQRVLISRAVAVKPSILILDDSSSALDYKTEASLRKALKDNLSDTLIINIAQRVSAIKDCDKIIVLDEGKIIGYGTHDYLLSNCKEYSEINESQIGGAFVE